MCSFMGDMTNPVDVANFLGFDITNSASQSLFSSFNVILDLNPDNRYGGMDAFLQKKFNPYNCTYVLTILTCITGEDREKHSMSCLLQWTDFVWGDEKMDSDNTRFDKLIDWMENNLPKNAFCKPEGGGHVPGTKSPFPPTKSAMITFPGDYQVQKRICRDFQGYVEKLCNHISSL